MSKASESNQVADVFKGEEKVFNDNVHGQMKLPGIFSSILNSSTIQRLRNLKQLGLAYYVYPSACHNRFEHCVGTAYLAGKYGEILQKNQPELNIDDIDILCLRFAGLLHDIGHGPFSHTFEGFMKTTRKKYKHEDMSIKLFERLIETDLKSEFKAANIPEDNTHFIKELILGKTLPKNGKKIQVRPPCKHFLYQIVANKKTGIDVDKFDYLLRDSKQLNVTTTFDYQRLMDNSRVVGYKDGAFCDKIVEDTPTIIVYRKKISDTLEDLFRSRFSLHQKAYQHRVTKVIEEMVVDGLAAANEHFDVPGSDGKYKLSTAYEDPTCDAFLKLTDSIFERIQLWDEGGPEAAKIFNDIVTRNLYGFLGCFSGVANEALQHKLTTMDKKIKLITSTINYGGEGENPLNKVLLFEKARPNKLFKMEPYAEPEKIRTFIVYCSNESNAAEELEKMKNKVKELATEYQMNLEYE